MDVILLNIKTIPGESQLKDYVSTIELLSFSHGVAMQVTGDPSNTERTSGKPNHQDLTVSKYVDLASCPLVAACNAATNLGEVVLTCARNDKGAVLPYLVYTLENVLVSSVSHSSGSGDKPTETVTLNYTKISWDFTSQNSASGAKGNNGAVWDLALNATA